MSTDVIISYFLTFIALCMIVRPWAAWVLTPRVTKPVGLALVVEFILGIILLLACIFIRNW